MKQDLTAQINVDENGEYTFYAVTSKGLKPISGELGGEVKIEGDTFKMFIESPEPPKMKVEIAVTFGEETAEGYFKLPILGKMKFSGEKVEMTDIPVIDESVTLDDAKEKLEEE
jgi:hypothetical protein